MADLVHIFPSGVGGEVFCVSIVCVERGERGFLGGKGRDRTKENASPGGWMGIQGKMVEEGSDFASMGGMAVGMDCQGNGGAR